jgi:hypothetical protein
MAVEAHNWQPLLFRGGMGDDPMATGKGSPSWGTGQRSALVTLAERESGHVHIGRVDSITSDMTMREAKRRIKDLPPSLKQSMTMARSLQSITNLLTRGLGLKSTLRTRTTRGNAARTRTGTD